ncbi:transmembrane 9 superfamily member 1-like, partial [Rhincodon typus]|uniref:transmembrane 9 superfamily member 1-like n=1 Tax=Rhincodon typus TaxID=259920 RepID=UPI00202F57BC
MAAAAAAGRGSLFLGPGGWRWSGARRRRRRRRGLAVPGLQAALLLLLLLGWAEGGGGGGGRYQVGEAVTVYVNKVGPYHNPQETYHYYRLPVCRPDRVRHKSLSLGELLDGDRMAESLYQLAFRRNQSKRLLCELRLEPPEIEELKEAIEELYYFEFVLDDIPIRGFVGYLEESGFLPHTHKIGLWTHLDFHVEFNGDRVIYANVSVRDVKPFSLDELRAPVSMAHTYSVYWHETSFPYERRGERLRDSSFFPRTLEIHWLSIINSMVLVFLLTGFVVIILMRVLRNDFARYNLEEEAAADDFDQADNGWKIVHTDVFRFPPHKSLLCSVLGVGTQFLALGTGERRVRPRSCFLQDVQSLGVCPAAQRGSSRPNRGLHSQLPACGAVPLDSNAHTDMPLKIVPNSSVPTGAGVGHSAISHS